jgi:hypothetical protein
VATSLLDELMQALRLARALPGYLRHPFSPAQCRERIAGALADRAGNFCRLIEEGVFGRLDNPYRHLFRHAGVGVADVRALVGAHGVEGALGALFTAGIHVRLDEFKGRRPIRRGSLELPVTSQDFNNPSSARHLAVQTGGSRSGGTRYYVDLEHYADEAVHYHAFLDSFGLYDRPYALWRPTPPWHAGIKGVFRCMLLGKTPDRWFTQNRMVWSRRNWRHTLFTRYVVHASRLHGRPLPAPEHVPLDEAWRIAEWLAACKKGGRPASLNSNASSGVRVCMAALERGLDIAGTIFRASGEPLTVDKRRVFEQAGCRVLPAYIMGEVGLIGLACSNPTAVDDMHLLDSRLALIQRPQAVGGQEILANVYTALQASAPKLMINVVSDDYSVVEERSCGCPLEAVGYGRHIHTIRSYEKLTSEGMTFLGSDLLRLVEQVLPERFGGSPTDYQFLEEEEGGLPRVSLLVDPRVGPLDEGAVVETIIDFLNHLPGSHDNYGERWREARTLRVRRQPPIATGASKILALHVQKPKSEHHEHR